MGYQNLEMERDGPVGTLWLSRPEKRNALSADMWDDIPNAVAELEADDSIRVVVLAGRGPSFCAGIDVEMLASLAPSGTSQARSNLQLYDTIKRMQKTASCFAEIEKPVIASIQGVCLGAGLDLITACDIRLASSDAIFSIRETRMALVADVGSLQRLPAIIGAGALAEMAYTGGDFGANWAREHGLVNHVSEDVATLHDRTRVIAQKIASNSPLVMKGIKHVLAAANGRTVEQALDYVAQWNSSFLLSNDLTEAVNAFLERRDPDFTGT